MECKAFEIRDVGTFIPVIAVLMLPHHSPGSEEGEAEHYLLRRAGYGLMEPVNEALIMVCRMDANGSSHQASYDPYGWGGTTTMAIAQVYMAMHWAELKSGQVIDVEFIAGITNKPKISERLEAFERAGRSP